MTREEAKEVFLNRGFIDGIYDGNKWREACIVISKWLEQEPTYVSELTQKAYEDGKKDGYVQAKIDQEPVLDKIRAEIISRGKNVKAVRSDNCCFFTAEEVLQIIDKYKAENEQ